MEEVKKENFEDVMNEMGTFTVGAITFTVIPIYFGEESRYFRDVTLSPMPVSQDGDKEFTDKELAQWGIALFSEETNSTKPIRFRKLKELFFKIFPLRNYRYYYFVPVIQPLIKWIERKVRLNGKRIRFYDLERKYKLTKADIEKLIIYIHELSFF